MDGVYKSRELENLQQEIERLKKEAADQKWGLQKTNEGIKILYKELERKNQKLKELDQLKSNFVSVVSHELRTPLNIIKEGVSQILEGLCGEANERQKTILTYVLNNSDRLTRIIDELLDISKLEAGKVKLHRSLMDIVPLVNSLTVSFTQKFYNKSIQLKEKFSHETMEAYIDPDKVVQIFTNLIGNAIKFTQAGTIEIGKGERANRDSG